MAAMAAAAVEVDADLPALNLTLPLPERHERLLQAFKAVDEVRREEKRERERTLSSFFLSLPFVTLTPRV